MEITLVTSTNGEEVHGTDNDKKTGCGINLLKVENVTRYIKKGTMTDLKELTCEKCKTVLAKKIIKADKKEMARLIKEEKARAKKGIEDENIIPLGNTQAKITAPQKPAPAAAAPAPKAEPAPEPAPKAAAPEPETAPSPKTIPGTGIAIDNDLAQFAINVPKEEEPKPEINKEPDILSQFAINKPDIEDEFSAQPEPEAPAPSAAPVQDDFLAQFAINVPGSEPEPAAVKTPEPAAEEPYDAMEAPAAEESAPAAEEYKIPEPEFSTSFDHSNESSEMNDLFAAPAEENAYMPASQESAVPDVHETPVQETAEEESVDDDDIMKMFSISSGNADSGMEVLARSVPDETSIYDNDESVVDIDEDEVTAAPEIEIPAEEIQVEEASDAISDWDAVANQLFGSLDEPADMPEITSVPEPEPVAEAMPEPEPVAEIMPEPEPVAEVMPEPEPVAEIMPEPEPVAEAMPEPEPVAEIMPEPEPVAEIMPEPEPVAEAMPEPEPVAEAMPEPEPVAEAAPDISYFNAAPVEDESMKKTKHTYSAPVFADEAPDTAEPAPQPQMTAPVQPVPVQQPAPVPNPIPAAPVAPPMPEQPVIVPVPQFAGYDMNGQPVYTYIQSQIVGYDPSGQPIFVPVQPMGQPQMAAPMQTMTQPQMAAPMQAMAQPQMTAPVQPAPAPQPQMTAPVQPVAAPQPQMTAPVQPAAPRPYTAPSGVNISKVGANRPMPKSVANAVANSKVKNQKNAFDMQGAQMPVLDSIEDILSSMGDDSVKKKKMAEKAVPVFDEYKVPSRNTAKKTSAPAAQKSAEPERPLTKAELKAKKKQDKIDQKFKKDLAKRGF